MTIELLTDEQITHLSDDDLMKIGMFPDRDDEDWHPCNNPDGSCIGFEDIFRAWYGQKSTRMSDYLWKKVLQITPVSQQRKILLHNLNMLEGEIEEIYDRYNNVADLESQVLLLREQLHTCVELQPGERHD